MKHKILVTGAGGYIGSITSDLLLQKGFDIVAIDNFSRGYKQPLELLQKKYGEDRITFFDLDLVTGDLKKTLDDQKIEAIIHFAGLANVGESWKDPSLYFTNNVVGTQRLADFAIQKGIKHIVFSSSCTVYGNAQYLPIDESHPLANPESPYGATKKMDEEILTWYGKTDLLKYCFLRYFNVTGASDDFELGDSKKPSFHLIQNAIRGALKIAPFELNYAPVNTPDGSPIRDYTNVVDLANAHILAIEYLLDKNGESTVFNLGTGEGQSVLEIISLIKEKTGFDFPVTMAQDRRIGEADKMIADISKAKEVLGWQPSHTLSQSIDSLIEWYKKHPQGWRE